MYYWVCFGNEDMLFIDNTASSAIILKYTPERDREERRFQGIKLK